METRMDKLRADARFEANPPKPAPIADATTLWIELGKAYLSGEDHGDIEGIPVCTTGALFDLLNDDDINEDIQVRAERRLAAAAIEALHDALVFARARLSEGYEVDRACVRGTDAILRKAGLVLAAPEPAKRIPVDAPRESNEPSL